MNILRKSRKSTIKLDKRKVVLLIFTLIMTTFAWITYSKILLPTLKLHINSWNISIYVDDNKNGVAEEGELADKTAPIVIQPFEVYPGMNKDVMDVIIKNNGETPSDIAYIISDIKFLGNTYSIQDDASAYRTTNPGAFCLQKNTYEDYGGIVTYKLINEESMIPFEFIIEHTKVIDGGAEGYLKVKAVWDATLDEGATEAQIDAKNEFDGKWGFDLTKYAEATGAPIEFKLKVNAIGQPRSGRFVLTQDITPENYGDYVDYSVDLNGDGNTKNDWRIFYEDNENIYIIAAGLVKNTEINTEITELSETEGCTVYGVNMNHSEFTNTPIDKSIINKFMLTDAEESNNINYKATANLLSTSHWSQFVDSNLAVAAIGGPTVEMFVRSWNQKYDYLEGCTEIICEWDTQKQGYNVNDEEGEEYHLYLTGYENASLYFPNHTGDSCHAYWLASPSSKEYDHETGNDMLTKGMIGIRFDTALIAGGGIANGRAGVRPLVQLKSGIFGEVTEISPGNRVWTLTTVHPNDREEVANIVGNEVVEE